MISTTSPEDKLTQEVEELNELQNNLEELDKKLIDAEDRYRFIIENVHPHQKVSAVNLVHYLALRCEDIRQLQDRLHILGLSSLASSESHVRRQLQSILQRLGKHFEISELSPLDYYRARKIGNQNTTDLFGIGKPGVPYIMVTMNTELASDFETMKKLLEAGMHVARINCAHDNREVWLSMIEMIKHTSDQSEIPCKIYMDLPGPKMRSTLLGLGRDGNMIPVFKGLYFTFAEQDAIYDPESPVIGCQEPGVVEQLNVGDRVLFDDGLEEALVISKGNGIASLKMIRVSSKKSRLKAQKGINFPTTKLSIPPLTEFDKSVLPFVCEHADMVGYSFVRNASDVAELQQAMKQFARQPQIILKIETSEAVQNLPTLLVQGMQEKNFGVMIARGDLAVEIGFGRMSEIQEEILWICEAGHVPVIWATQVLETLNKRGIATRPEVTDAYHAVMAECVLLNKGAYIFQVIETLRDILSRSGTHHAKKRYTLRPMQIAKRFMSFSVK